MNRQTPEARGGLPLRVFTSYAILLIALGLVAAIIGPAIPALAEQTGFALYDGGLLFTARSLGIMIGAGLLGRMFDRLPGHLLLSAFAFLLIGCLAWIPVAGTFAALLGLMGGIGLAEGALHVGTNALLIRFAPAKATRRLTGLHLFFGLGATVAPVAVAMSLDYSGETGYAFVATGLVALAGPLLLLGRSAPAHGQRGQEYSTGDAHPVTGAVVLFVAFFAVYVGLEATFGGWIYTWAFEGGAATADESAVMTSLFWGGLTAGRLMGVIVGGRFEEYKVLLTGIGLASAVVGAMIFVESGPLLWVIPALLGTVLGPVFPTAMGWAGRKLHLGAAMTGRFFLGASIGSLVMPWIVGRLMAGAGAIAFPVSLLLLAVGMGLIIRAIRRGSRV